MPINKEIIRFDSPGKAYDDLKKQAVNKLSKYITKHRKKADFAPVGVIPRSKVDANDITESDLLAMGFEPSLIAVPEINQSQLLTYRHPDNNLHFHKHDDVWLMHNDKHPSLSMTMKKFNKSNLDASILDKAQYFFTKALPESAPHVFYEGLPGWTGWIANQIEGKQGFLANNTDQPTDYLRLLTGAGASALGISTLEYLLGNKKADETLSGNLTGVLGFIVGNKIAQRVQNKLENKDDKYKQANLLSALTQTGIPIASALIGKFGTEAIIRYLKNRG